ncbi:MAG: hypothetical protein ABH873_03890 [Candidatus Firestonebacteria bacterium]
MLKVIVVVISILIVSNVYSQEVVAPKVSVTPEITPPVEVITQEAVKPVLPDISFKEVIKRPAKTVCAVTGSPLEVTDKTPFIVSKEGTVYYFLNEEAKMKFQAAGQSWKYVRDILTCQVCGTQEKKRGRGTQFFQEARYEGRAYFFCSNTHKIEFMKDPGKFNPKPVAIIVKNPKPKPPKKPAKIKKPISPTTEEVKVPIKEVTPEITPEAGLVTPEVKSEIIVVTPEAPAVETTKEVPVVPIEEITK